MTTALASPATRGGDGLGALIGAKVFIAGGGSGMGAVIAKLAVARGASVALAGRSHDKLAAVAADLRGQAIGLHAIDLADAAAVETALAANGSFDHIVTTVADLAFKPLADLSEAEIGRILASKFWGPVNLARAAMKHLLPTGSLIFFSGVAAYRQSVGTSVVGALNMALESLAAGLAIELKPRRVNVISPGVVDSPTWASMSDAERQKFFQGAAESLPVGRVGAVQDIAHAAVSLMENGFISGTVLSVDGGGRIA